jgi:SAM-dependent methyltransferase
VVHGMAGGEQHDPVSRRDSSYIFPRHPNEVDRLDLQHFALQEAAGANYLAPVLSPALILDVGSGTGRWAAELCVDFPEAMVVALDLQASKPHALPNYRFVRSNVLEGLPFASDSFDFVHQRLLGTGLPLKSWAAVVRDLVRVSRPNGWVELVEGRFDLQPAGAATARLFQLAWRLASSLGLDTTGITFGSLDDYLLRAGAVQVERRTLEIPVGEWGGRIGSFIASDFRAAFTRLCEVFQARFDLSAEECGQLVQNAQREWETERSRWAVALAIGRKPAASPPTGEGGQEPPRTATG